MSTFSDKPLPNLNSGTADEVICTDWNAFAALLETENVDEFALWLDDELVEMEQQLDQFVSAKSRYSGRR